jgi:hypothetical protein
MYGGEKIAAVLQAHGIIELFTLCGGHLDVNSRDSCEA